METRPPVDPIMTPQEMCQDAGISLATWTRNYRRKLPVIRVTPRRIGVRRSAWLKALEENTERGRAA